jgi:CxxC-x17-CxxC domain-containing protein
MTAQPALERPTIEVVPHFISGGRRVSFVDKTLTCVDCGVSFIFSAEDQAFHQEKGFTNEPRRCLSCRAAKRAERNGGDSFGRSYSSGPREMFTTTCSQCGKEARVPFQPRGDRPVYCNDCFRKTSGSYASGRY